MGRISLFRSLGGPQYIVLLSVNFGVSFKIVYCKVDNHKNSFGYINTKELLVHMSYMRGPHLVYAFSYSFGSPKRLEIRKLQAA